MAGVAVWWPFGNRHGRVGLVVVSPRHQRRGLGRALMERVLDDAGGRALALLATEEGHPLYEKFGFRTIGRTQRHVGRYTQPTIRRPGIEQFTRADLASVLKTDRLAFGSDRAPVIRHLLKVGKTCIARDGKEIVGYAIIRPFGLGHVVGPVVATGEPLALNLFKAVAQPGYLRVDRPFDTKELGAFVEESGLHGHETSHTMALGDWPGAENGSRIFALSNHAWG